SLRWDNCFDDGGAANKTFACDTNSGNERLVFSFVLASPLTNILAVESFVEILASSASLPTWWQLLNSGSCRSVSLLPGDAPPTAVQCSDWGRALRPRASRATTSAARSERIGRNSWR